MKAGAMIKRHAILKAADDLFEIANDAALTMPARIKIEWARKLLLAIDKELGENEATAIKP